MSFSVHVLKKLGGGKNTHSVLEEFFMCQYEFRGQNEQSDQKGWWSLFQCWSWNQKQMCHCLHRACRIDQIPFQKRRCEVSDELIVRLILVSFPCVKIGLCLVPGPSTFLLVLRRRPSLRTETVQGTCYLLVWNSIWSWLVSLPCQWWSWLCFWCTCVWLMSIVLGCAIFS